MSLHPNVLDALLAAGASAEMIVAAVKADAALDAQRVTDRRAKDRDRQQRHRESRGVTVTKRDKGSNERDNLTSKTEVTEASASSPRPWACPPKVDPDHWRDFRRNRRTRHLTDSETAYRGQLKAIAQFADDEWPPGRLVQFAAEKGWGSINDPRTPRHGQSSSNITSLRGARPDPALDLLRAARAAENREADRGAGAALPAIGSG